MVRAVKTKSEGKYLYINLLDFKDEIEQDVFFEKIQRLIKESKPRRKVF